MLSKVFLVPLLLGISFLVVLFFLQRFPLSPEEVQENYLAWSLGNQPKLSPEAKENLTNFPKDKFIFSLPIKKFFPTQILLSPKFHRLPNLILSILILVLVSSFVFKYQSPSIYIATVFFLSLTPWYALVSVFNFSSLIILTLSLLLFFSFFKSKLLFIILSLFLILFLFLHRFQLVSQTIFSDPDTSISHQSFEVDQRVRQEFKLNGYQDIIPIAIKRIGYNKYFFYYRRLAREALKIFDWERLSSPSQVQTTIAKNLWSERGFPLLFFWQIPLFFLGLFSFSQLSPQVRKLCSVFLIWGLFLSFIAPNSNLETSGFPLVIPISIICAFAISKILRFRYWLSVPGLFVLWAAFAVYHHFLFHELYWRDNRPFVFTQAVKLFQDNPTSSPTLITNILGPTHFYYAWGTRLQPDFFWKNYSDNPDFGNVSFRHFDLTKAPLNDTKVFIGLPGEFLGNQSLKQQNDFNPASLPPLLSLKATVPIKQIVSFGNGNYLWLVERK